MFKMQILLGVFLFLFIFYFFNVKLDFVDIESKLKRIEDDPEGSGTAHLFKIIEGVSSQANRAFQSLFERQVCGL